MDWKLSATDYRGRGQVIRHSLFQSEDLSSSLTCDGELLTPLNGPTWSDPN